MMNVLFRLAIRLSIVPALLGLALSANADNHVKQSCLSVKESSSRVTHSLCHSYILGFLQGALLTDTAIIDSLNDQKSEFLQRVYKTRAPRSGRELPPTYLAKFCLPEPPGQNDIINNVISHLDENDLQQRDFEQAVYQTIKAIYPCQGY